jgi:hypothetical protein
MANILQEIIETLTGGLVQYGKGIGSAINQTVQSMFIAVEGTGADAVSHLSTAGYVVIIFAAVALGVGLTTLLFNWLTSLGNR